MKNPPAKFKINILYILAFQLLGCASVLFFEAESFQESKPEINIAMEDNTTENHDFVMELICTPEGCQRVGP